MWLILHEGDGCGAAYVYIEEPVHILQYAKQYLWTTDVTRILFYFRLLY